MTYRWVSAALGVLASLSSTSSAGAADCQNNNSRNCWARNGTPTDYGANASAAAAVRGLVCIIATGGSNAPNRDVSCYKPIGSSGHQQVQGGLAVPNRLQLKSIALWPPAGNVLGTTLIFVLGVDNAIYMSVADTNFPSGGGTTPFRLMTQPIDENGNALAFKEITVNRHFGRTYLVGVTASGEVRYMDTDTNRWPRFFPSTLHAFAYSDTEGMLTLSGSSAVGSSLILSGRFPSIVIPPVPSGQLLSRWSRNFTEQFGSASKPVALNTSQAYLLTDSATPANHLLQSTLVNGVWQAWTPYLNLAEAYPRWNSTTDREPLPWSVIDARYFRSTAGTPGAVFLVGSNFRMYEWVP